MTSFAIRESSFGVKKGMYLRGSFSLVDDKGKFHGYRIMEDVQDILDVSPSCNGMTYKILLRDKNYLVISSSAKLYDQFHKCFIGAKNGSSKKIKKAKKQVGVIGIMANVLLLGLFVWVIVSSENPPTTKPPTAQEITKRVRDEEVRRIQEERSRAKRIEQYMATIATERDYIKNYNVESGITDNTSTLGALYVIEGWAKTYEKRLKFGLSDIQLQEVEMFKKEASALQRKIFVRMRTVYGPESNSRAWEYDVAVRVFGDGARTIEYVGSAFAANRNIQAFMETALPSLKKLRFKKARFKWYKGADEFTNYDLEVPADGDLVIWGSNGFRVAQ